MEDAWSQTEEMEQIYEPDQMIGDRWIIEKSIGEGNNGFIFSVNDAKRFEIPIRNRYALKIQNLETRSSIMESEINFYQSAKDLANRSSTPLRHVLSLIDFGFHTNGAIYFVAPLLGQSLDKIVEKAPEKKLSLCVAFRIGRQILDAIAEVNRLGYVHRNVKPSNFAFDFTNANRLYIIDFGRVRLWSEKPDNAYLSRSDRYSGPLWFTSLKGHAKKVLNRQDDLQSWLYTLSYLASGTLPWLDQTDKNLVADSKLEAENNPKTLYDSFPIQIWRIRNYVKELRDDDEPDYQGLAKLIDEAFSAVCQLNCKSSHYPFLCAS